MEVKGFNELKSKLLNDAGYIEDITSESFKESFLKLIELCILSLMEGTDNFFALFMLQLKREINTKSETAVASRVSSNGLTIYFNPKYFLECSLLEIQALIKHEIYHIMSNHHFRRKALLNDGYTELAVSLAMDITVNEYIMNLPWWSVSIDTVKRSYNVILKEGSTLEEYTADIQKALDRFQKEKEKNNQANTESNLEDTHALWNFDEIADAEVSKETIKKLASNSAKGVLPQSIDELLGSLNKKPQLDWKVHLKRYIGTISTGYKKTSTRRDRRQPDRLELRGKLSRHTVELIVAIDISGSITDEQIDNIMVEIFSLVKNYPYKITIVECDSEIRRTYNVHGVRDIRKKLDTKGATKFEPVFEYITRKNLINHLLIYFTDGMGEEEIKIIPKNLKVLWILTGKEQKLSLKSPFGTVEKLSRGITQKLDWDYAKNEIKEYRMLEWAK